jgi:glycosyltransferase involved in cell wall biosynthesis
VVVAHGSTTLPACALGLAATGTPFIYRSIGTPLDWANTRARRVRVRLFLRRAARVAALWPGAADQLVRDLGVPGSKIVVIPNGRPSAQFPVVTDARRAQARRTMDVPDGAPVALVLGSLSPEKGVDIAIEALSRLPDLRLLVVGDGREARALEARAAMVAPGRCFFRGATSVPAIALAAADVVVLPSRSEGLPGVAIEAGMCGLPVVATDVGGTREVVVSGHTGVLVPPEDPEALARGIQRCLDAGSELGENGRLRSLERFDMQVVAGQWSALIADVDGERRID